MSGYVFPPLVIPTYTIGPFTALSFFFFTALSLYQTLFFFIFLPKLIPKTISNWTYIVFYPYMFTELLITWVYFFFNTHIPLKY